MSNPCLLNFFLVWKLALVLCFLLWKALICKNFLEDCITYMKHETAVCKKLQPVCQKITSTNFKVILIVWLLLYSNVLTNIFNKLICKVIYEIMFVSKLKHLIKNFDINARFELNDNQKLMLLDVEIFRKGKTFCFNYLPLRLIAITASFIHLH